MDERAKEDVEAFIRVLKDQYKIDILDVQRAVRFFDTYDRRSEFIAKTIIKTLVIAIMSGIGYIIYLGVMQISKIAEVL